MQDEGPRNGYPLLLASGELAGVALLESRKLHEVEHRAHGLPDLGLRAALELEAEGDVAEDGQVREEGVVLEDHSEAAPLRGKVVDALVIEPHLSVALRDEPGDDVQRRRLAAPARPEEGHELAAAHFEGKVAEDRLRPEALGQPEAQRVERLAHCFLIFCAPTSLSQRSMA